MNEAPFLIAAFASAGNGVSGHYNGKIDNPRIYGRALSRAEIEARAVVRAAAHAGAVSVVAVGGEIAVVVGHVVACAALQACDDSRGTRDAARTGDASTGIASPCKLAGFQSAAPDDTVITKAERKETRVPHCLVEGFVTTTNPGPNRNNFRLQLPDDFAGCRRAIPGHRARSTTPPTGACAAAHPVPGAGFPRHRPPQAR